MKLLILGARGNLGNQLMEVYAELNPTGWDRSELDVTDEQKVWDKIQELKPDLVFNCTAYNAVDKAEEDRVTADSVNGYAVGNIAKVCKAIGATLVHYSTGMVFDGNSAEGYNEEDGPSPVNAYGRSKLLGEMELQQHCDQFYIIRTCWLFGKTGPGENNKKSFSDIMLEKAAKNEPISVVDDEFGNPTYILDLAQASRALVEMEKPHGVYHIVNTGAASRFDWAKETFAARGVDVQIQPIKGMSLARMAKRPHYEILNNTKFLEMRPWTEALREFLK